MRARNRRALTSHLENLLVHLLKWRYQPARSRSGHSWADSIREARAQLAAGLSNAYADSPQFHASVVRRYRAARREASRQTGLPLATFPLTYPWTIAQLLDEDFWSEATLPTSC